MQQIRNNMDMPANARPARAVSSLALILFCGVVAGGYGFYYNHLNQSPPTVEARILIDRAGVNMDWELEQLRAPILQQATIAEMDLDKSSEFRGQGGQMERLLSGVEAVFQGLGLAANGKSREVSPADVNSRWSQIVNLSSDIGTRTLRVSVTLPNANLAIKIADNLARRFAEIESGTADRAGSLDILRAELQKVQAELEVARAEGRTGAANPVASYEQLRAKALKIKELVTHGQYFDAIDLLDQPVVRALAEQRRQIKADLLNQGRTLLDQHPVMIELRARLAKIEADIRPSAAKAVAILDSDIFKARQAAEKARNEPQIDTVPTLEARAQDLRQKLNEQLLKIASGEAVPDAPQKKYRIFLPAELPTLPSLWQDAQNAAFAALFGSGLGLGIVLMRRGRSEKKAVPALPVIADMPVASPTANVEPQTIEKVKENTRGFKPLAKSAVRDEFADIGPHVLLLHGFSDEDIGPVVEDFAAQARIVLVDLGQVSMRRRHHYGLGELMTGQAEFHQVVHKSLAETHDILPAGCARNGRIGLDLVVETLSESYDYVLLRGLDVTGGDFDEIAPLITTAILVQTHENAEEIWFIERHLDHLGTAEIVLVPPSIRTDLREAA